jgi:cytidine deaminase
MNRKITEMNKKISEQIQALPKKHRSLIDKIKKEQTKKLGPAVAGVLDTKTGKIYFGANTPSKEIPKTLHDIVDGRINGMPQHVQDYYKATYGKGTHAEVKALNKAFLEREDANISDFMVYVVSTGYDAKGSGNLIKGISMARCPHCEYITNGTKFIPEVKWFNKLQGRKYGDYDK